MMEKVIKDNIWTLVKADGRLVSRTNYGVSYHALMLVSLLSLVYGLVYHRGEAQADR